MTRAPERPTSTRSTIETFPRVVFTTYPDLGWTQSTTPRCKQTSFQIEKEVISLHRWISPVEKD